MLSNIIDGRARLRSPEMMKAWTTDLNPVFADYIGKYKMGDRLSVRDPMADIEEARKSGVTGFVIGCGTNAEVDEALRIRARYGRDPVQAYISILSPVSLSEGISGAVRDVSEAIDGVNLAPVFWGVDVDDRRLYPVYSECERLGVACVVHSSIHYYAGSSMSHNDPMKFDRVARDFPHMRLVLSHGGNGFGPVVLAVAQRHRNVWLEFSALNPEYMAPEFIHAANSYLSDRCVFGSDYPLVPWKRAVDMWAEAINDSNQHKFFQENMMGALRG